MEGPIRAFCCITICNAGQHVNSDVAWAQFSQQLLKACEGSKSEAIQPGGGPYLLPRGLDFRLRIVLVRSREKPGLAVELHPDDLRQGLEERDVLASVCRSACVPIPVNPRTTHLGLNRRTLAACCFADLFCVLILKTYLADRSICVTASDMSVPCVQHLWKSLC